MFKIPKLKRPEDWLLLLIGATMRIDINLVGRLALSEIISVLVVMLYLGRIRRMFQPRQARVFFGMLSLWFLAVLLSDLYNQTQTMLMLRGLARPVIIGFLFAALFVLLERKPNAVIFFFFGLLLAGALNVAVPTDFRAVDLVDSESYSYYAFIYTPLLIAGAAVLAWLVYPSGALLSVSVLAIFSLIATAGFSRTTAGALMFSAILILFGRMLHLKQREYWHGESTAKKSMQLVLAFMVMIFFLLVYVNLAVEGFLGEQFQEKIIEQTSRPTDIALLNLFLTGRHYNISNYLMIRENPLFGTGSWPLSGEYDYRALLLVDSDIGTNFLNKMDTLRGTGHSILLGGWANYGPLSVPFWIYILFKCVMLLKVSYTVERRLFVVMCLYLVIFMFSIIFNNLNSLNRVFAALVPVLLVTLQAPERRVR
jgi:hypothetical protein